MASWSFQRTLILGLIVIGLLAILSSVASLVASRSLVASMEDVANDEAADLADTEKLRSVGARMVADGRAYLLTGEARFARETRAGSDAVRGAIERLRPRVTSGRGHNFLEQVERTEREHREWFERALALRTSNPSRGQLALFTTEYVEPRVAAFEKALDGLVSQMESELLRALNAAHGAVGRAQGMLRIVMFATLMLAAILSLILSLSLNRSYREQTSARAVAEARHSRAKAAQSEAEEASRLKDEFLATVSHELRGPLAPILAWTQLLRSGTLDEEKSQHALEAIERSAQSLAQLIDDLLDVSRVVSGKFRMDVRPIDVGPVIKAAVESQRPAIDAKQIRLQLVLDQRAGVVSGDRERLQQVIWNLLSNAIKFTPRGGRVQVVLERVQSHMELSVSDTGAGIAPTFLPHVFEPFRQEASGTKRRHSGLGLGLSVVRHIVELHGGEVTAQSDGAGRGSTFIVKLPLLVTRHEVGDPTRRHPISSDRQDRVTLARLDRIRVLVVDDEPGTNDVMRTLLGSCGAEVRAAESAAQALEVLDTWKPDVLVSDIGMPDQDGYALIAKVRKRSPQQGGEIPAVALTAYARIEDRVKILSAGFQMYLSKPTDPIELVAVVGSLAGRPGAGRSGA